MSGQHSNATGSAAPRLVVEAIDLFERDVRLRMPFRFGVVTLTEAPQAFARVRIRLERRPRGRGHGGRAAGAEVVRQEPGAEQRGQLRPVARRAGHRARPVPRGATTPPSATSRATTARRSTRAAQGLNPLVANYGPALIDRALLDALCRALQHVVLRRDARTTWPASAQRAVRRPGGLRLRRASSPACSRRRASRPATPSGLVDPITRRRPEPQRVGDGLPETLEEVVARYGHRWFKLKVGGDVAADVERLLRIAAVLDRIGAATAPRSTATSSTTTSAASSSCGSA